MNFIRLTSYHRLYAFSDYRSMKSALPYLQRVVLAKSLTDVEETDARRFVERIDGQGYRNYLAPISGRIARPAALQSLVTALQALYKSNGYAARYIVIERG